MPIRNKHSTVIGDQIGDLHNQQYHYRLKVARNRGKHPSKRKRLGYRFDSNEGSSVQSLKSASLPPRKRQKIMSANIKDIDDTPKLNPQDDVVLPTSVYHQTYDDEYHATNTIPFFAESNTMPRISENDHNTCTAERVIYLELLNFLEQHGLSKYYDVMVFEGYDVFKTMRYLVIDDLFRFGVKTGHARLMIAKKDEHFERVDAEAEAAKRRQEAERRTNKREND
eukprot:615617_1